MQATIEWSSGLPSQKLGRGGVCIGLEWGVIVVEGLLYPGGKGDVLIVFWENLLHAGSVSVTQNKGEKKQPLSVTFLYL